MSNSARALFAATFAGTLGCGPEVSEPVVFEGTYVGHASCAYVPNGPGAPVFAELIGIEWEIVPPAMPRSYELELAGWVIHFDGHKDGNIVIPEEGCLRAYENEDEQFWCSGDGQLDGDVLTIEYAGDFIWDWLDPPVGTFSCHLEAERDDVDEPSPDSNDAG